MLVVILTSILVIFIAYLVHNNFYKTSANMSSNNLRRSTSLPNNCTTMGNIFTKCFKRQTETTKQIASPAYFQASSQQRLSRVSSLTDKFDKFRLSSESDASSTGSINVKKKIADLCARAWNGDNPDELFVKAFDIQITRKDLQNLNYGNWLNDEIINFYFNLICDRSVKLKSMPKVYAFNTFFFTSLSNHGYNRVKRWTRNVNIFNFDVILVPIHLGIHWCLAAVDFKYKRLSFYDSMAGDGNRYLVKILNYLVNESHDKHQSKYSLDGFDLLPHAIAPRQHNGYDCGVFICQFAEYASRQAKFDFSQADIKEFREQMVFEIVEKRLLD